MCADEQPKPRFEPPPWEREAFEQFQKEKAEREAREREAAEVVARAAAAVEQQAAVVPAPEPVLARAVVQQVPEGVSLGGPVAPVGAAISARTSKKPALPEAQVEAMLIQLRAEESPPIQPNIPLVNSVMVVLVLIGVYIMVQALLWVAKGSVTDSPDSLLRITASLLVFMAGAGFIGGAYLLFRKYHM